MKEIIIQKEDAVFWLDKAGYWQNDGGKFRKKKIIDLFHRSIGKDENGYFVSRTLEGILEKVYFRYEDTALFVFAVHFNDDILLSLNTGKQLRLVPEDLYIKDDNLYLTHADEPIKFSERALMRIFSLMEEDDQSGQLVIHINGNRFYIPEKKDINNYSNLLTP